MFIGIHAQIAPSRPAVINSATGETMTYRDLDERSNQFAQYLAANGVKRGDTVALFMENNMRFMEIVWATRRSGLYLTAVNRYLMADEAAYIINDSDAVVVVASKARGEVASALTQRLPNCRRLLMTDGTIEGWSSYENAVAPFPVAPVAEEWIGELIALQFRHDRSPQGREACHAPCESGRG